MATQVTLYTRPACPLCDTALERLMEIGRRLPLEVTTVDVLAKSSPAAELADRVPVVEVAGRRYEPPLDWEAISAAIITAHADADARQARRRPATGWRRSVVVGLDRLILGFARHWVLVLTLFMALYAGLPFVAPVAASGGATGLARTIYRVYSPVCHQFAFRSWFLYGDQPVYPRERAGLERWQSFEAYAAAEPFFDGVDVTTLDAPLIAAAKAFPGSERMGYKVAFCQRDVAIYGSIALFGLAFALLTRAGVEVPKLPLWLYVLIAIVPIGLDGFSQFFANPPFNGFGLPFYPDRESIPLLRVLTGTLFGVGNAWLAFPYIEESMRDTRELLTAKLTRAGVLREPAPPA